MLIATELAQAATGLDRGAHFFRLSRKAVAEAQVLTRTLWSDLARTGPLWGGTRIVHRGRDLHPSVFTSGAITGGSVVHSYLDPTVVIDLLNDGATLICDHLQEHSRVVQDMQELLEYGLAAKVWMQAYLTKANEPAFAEHADDHNFYGLQLVGTKSWTLSGQGRPSSDIDLEPGMCVYCPAGTPHTVSGRGELSLHLTIAFDWLNEDRRLSGSALGAHELDLFAHIKRIGSFAPVAFTSDSELVKFAIFRFAARVSPQVDFRVDRIIVTDGAKQIGLDPVLKGAVRSLLTGGGFSIRDLAIASELDEELILQFVTFGVRNGFLLCA
jgi:Cupin superfamily protein